MALVQRVARMVGRVVGVAVAVFFALLVAALVAVGVASAAEALGMPHAAGHIVARAVLLAVATAEVLFWRRGRRSAAAKRHAAAQEVRQLDPHRYWMLLEPSQALASEEERDSFVGRRLIEEHARSAAATRTDRSEWVASSPAEATSVEWLTGQLENATLVRSLKGGGAELVGEIGWVGYRYVIDIDGTTTLVETDTSKVRRGRMMERAFFAGIILFLAGAVVAVVLDHTVGHAGWALTVGFAGGLIGFVGQTGLVGPRAFADSEQHWTTIGSGWREID